MKIGRKTLAIILLFVGLVLVNYLASTLPWRIDATADSIYTLSPGTKAILAKIEDPITLDFYFSRSAGGVPIAYKNYAARVEEMLQQYRRAADGHITLNVIDPKPDTPAEDDATSAGIEPEQLPTGDKFYFGLVAIQADQQKSIPDFTPQREPFLEYDLSDLIYRVQQINKKKLGLLTPLPLQGKYDLAAMQSGRMPQSQFVIDEWSQTYDIVPVDASAKTLPADLRRTRDHPSREPFPATALCHRPVHPVRQTRLSGRRSVLAIFQAPERPGGDVRHAPQQHVERPARPAQGLRRGL